MRTNSVLGYLALLYVTMCLTVDVCFAQVCTSPCGKTSCLIDVSLECETASTSYEFTPAAALMNLCGQDDQGGSPLGAIPMVTTGCYDATCTLLDCTAYPGIASSTTGGSCSTGASKLEPFYCSGGGGCG
jgi:hypothetical protein